jgi:CheY-like chemotaxis protein
MAIVLVIDNDAHARAMIEQYLSARGVPCDIANDPREAIARMSSRTYDYVFLDLDLGAGLLDGEGILAWMSRRKLEIPTLVISESAALPSVIRLENAYGFVKLRMTHGDLLHLGDLVDELMNALSAREDGVEDATVSRNELTVVGVVVTFIVLVAALAGVMWWLHASQFLAVLAGAVVVLIVVIAALLAQQGRLSERGLVTILREVLRKVSLGRKPTK